MTLVTAQRQRFELCIDVTEFAFQIVKKSFRFGDFLPKCAFVFDKIRFVVVDFVHVSL